MAGIDNNTILYLRGDSFKDLSLNQKGITNNGVSIDNNCFKFGASKRLVIDDNSAFTFGTGDFTVEMDIYLTSYSDADLFVSNKNYKDFYFSVHNNGRMRFDVIAGTDVQYGAELVPLNQWNNVCVVRKDGLSYLFLNGHLQGEPYSNTGNVTMTSPAIGYHNAYSTSDKIEGNVKNIRVSNIARYTEDFAPPTKPFNSIDINITNKDLTKADFNISKLGQETINKIEIIQNDEVKETFTDSYDNLTFNHNGKDFKIVVTYDDNYTEEQEIHIGNSKAKIWLYKEGNECKTITGGWSAKIGGAGNLLQLTKNETNISTVYTSGDRHVCLHTNNKIDADGLFRVLCDVIVDGGHTTVGVRRYHLYVQDSSTISPNNTNLGETFITDLSETIYVDNVSFEGGKYIGVYCGYVTGKISNIYMETKENVISINSQDNSLINFSCNTFDNLISITKAEVYINNQLSKSYTSKFDNLTYDIDNSLLSTGYNKISIKVTYTQGDDIYETVEEVLTHTNTVNNLPTSSSLKELIDRQELLTNSIEVQKNNLKSILESKNVDVSEEENKLSILIQKVNELVYGKLWLYKDGDECVDITGGWDNEGITSNATLTKSSDKMNLKVVSNSSSQYMCFANTKKIIDLSNYSKLYFEYETIFPSTARLGVVAGVSDTKATFPTKCNIREFTSVSRRIVAVDISSITKGYIVNRVASALEDQAGTLQYNIYRIWLEK